MEQNAVLARYLVPRSHKDAARLIFQEGFNPCGNQPHDLVLQKLPVAGVIFVPDHQVHRQSFQAPVTVGLDELACEVDVGRISDFEQHDWQVAGNGVAPQIGLPTAVLHEDARVRAERGIGVDYRTG